MGKPLSQRSVTTCTSPSIDFLGVQCAHACGWWLMAVVIIFYAYVGLVSERAGERLRMPVNGAGSALRAPPFEASRAHVQAGKFSVHFLLRFAIPRQRHQKWTTFRVSFEFLLDNIENYFYGCLRCQNGVEMDASNSIFQLL